jgi:hypothetical protein
MKKFTEKHRFSGTIFENKDILDDYIVGIEDLGYKLKHQSFYLFKHFNSDFFPVSKTSSRFVHGIGFSELVNIDQEILSKIEEYLFVGTELCFGLGLDLHCANAQRGGDIFYKPAENLKELFEEIGNISYSLSKRGYTLSFNIVNTHTEPSPNLILMIIYNK